MSAISSQRIFNINGIILPTAAKFAFIYCFVMTAQQIPSQSYLLHRLIFRRAIEVPVDSVRPCVRKDGLTHLLTLDVK